MRSGLEKVEKTRGEQAFNSFLGSAEDGMPKKNLCGTSQYIEFDIYHYIGNLHLILISRLISLTKKT